MDDVTALDFFAAQALNGLLAAEDGAIYKNDGSLNISADTFAHLAYELAEAMVKQKKERHNKRLQQTKPR
jgi:hypothetical protein